MGTQTLLCLCMLSCVLVYSDSATPSFRCDYHYHPAVEGWLKYHRVPAAWPEARLRCHLEGGTLASPINNDFTSTLSSFGGRPIFTGIHATFSNGDFHTIEGVPLWKLQHEWACNEPDNVGGSEQCTVLYADGRLADVPCWEGFPYVCYKQYDQRMLLNECGTVDHGEVLKLFVAGWIMGVPRHYYAYNIKAKLHKRYKESKLRCDYEAFSDCRANVKSLIDSAQAQYLGRIENHLIEDPKSFWNYVKSKRGSRSTQNIQKNGVTLTENECAIEFATYFQSVYSSAEPELDVEAAVRGAGGGNAGARVQLQQLQPGDVRAALQRLPPKRSAGPDHIPALIFKDCRYALLDALVYIFNLSLRVKEYPEVWKLTRVIPVPKGSASANVDGYRPVAVLSTPAKVFEAAIQRNMFLQVRSQLSDAQHGFRPGHSTSSNLLAYMADVLPAVDAGVQVDAAYFDFRKAFDVVDNDVLLMKLASVGCTPHLLQFFASYMRNRRQYVEYRGHQSQPYKTRSGVSQGSNLGPLEFILMINDLPKVVQNASCLLFADDLKLYLRVSSRADCERLQQDIDRVVEWSERNKLQFNSAKCVIISFSRAQSPHCHKYLVAGTPMARVSEVRDLGVRLTAQLKFRDHITNICKKAFRNLGFVLRRVQGFNNIRTIIAIYNALVRSHLEFNAVIWAPHEMKYGLMLERIQNKFIRYIYLRQYGVYPFYPLMYPTLFVLGMVGYNELRVRRELALMTYLFRLLNGRTSNSAILGRISLNVPDRYVERRRRPRLLAEPAARTNLLREAPLTRALRALNIVAEGLDLFHCSLVEFNRNCSYVLCYVINNKI
ncbi:unnamed protein product [Plutella xylostella]|uniref:(diamondback moth) hypothetical protein n=1 Tax=Plutella xylostella TaxID=51655 RepID=A0A8S4G9D7_PLUXY|nr:unnamed protein product [Plutella xylostella]